VGLIAFPVLGKYNGPMTTLPTLPDLMKLAAEEMQNSLSKTRTALSHSLSKGEAAEESFRKFLQQRLPDSLGVTKGQIIDSKGQYSRQLDAIVYNKLRTPMLFTSDQGDHQLVPSEGVVAVIEVKTKLMASMVPDLIANMDSVKSLDKSAYFTSTNSDITNSFVLYGEELDVFPTLYFVFAFEGADLGPIGQTLRQLNDVRPLKQRIDLVCVLESGIMINETIQDGNATYDGIPGPGSTMQAYATKHALLLWYLLLTRFVLQADSKAINLKKYVGADFQY
jgi:hypothetical protein